ncbi:hypothetical protein [Paenibacillus tianmuensis]|nr:hypothetical protein [Paenibacillus tianmuensis]
MKFKQTAFFASVFAGKKKHPAKLTDLFLLSIINEEPGKVQDISR